jgi:methylated-DNA-protein-cysteine methyltransferase-like protein
MKPFDKIYKIVSKIPKGKVLTYKKVAELSGVKNPRIVGFALHANTNPDQIPCHRVIKSDGYLARGYAFGGIKAQENKLKREGIVFLTKNRVDLSKSLN